MHHGPSRAAAPAVAIGVIHNHPAPTTCERAVHAQEAAEAAARPAQSLDAPLRKGATWSKVG
jgi:hypothetical protein